MITPIQKLKKSYYDNTIYVKRDDLLPFSFGGNKVRIAQEFLLDMEAKQKNCMIAYGNARSNLCRVMANFCNSKNVPCVVISPNDDDGNRIQTNNSTMAKLFQARYVLCEKTKVSDTVEKTIQACEEDGLDPYYIYGNKYGNGNKEVPVRAYEKVYYEIQEQLKEKNLSMDYIFLASGTGMTQSGLLLGKTFRSGSEKIVGISIAREPQSLKQNLIDYLKSYPDLPIHEDELLVYKNKEYANYGQYGLPIYETVIDILGDDGFALDATYTGKAFYGMKNYLRENQIRNKNVLFIHTGSTPLFFDVIKETGLQKDAFVRKLSNTATDLCLLEKFIIETSNEFAEPLLDRIDPKVYVNKILRLGFAYAIIDNRNEIEGVICGYANDAIKQLAYLTLLVTSKHLRGSGAAQMLFAKFVQYCKDQDMKKILFTTNKNNYAARRFYQKNKIPIIKEDDNLIYYCLQL